MGIAKKTIKEAWTTERLKDALRLRYDAQSYALLWEVRNATGLQHTTRYADALAMSLWPSRGLTLHGFEIKSSRSDWKKELDHPEKAESIARFCDRWWLVVGDREIVKPGELPATWGLLAPRGDVLTAHVEAKELKPEPFDRVFIASVLRSAQGQLGSEAREQQAHKRGLTEGRAEKARNRDYEFEDLKKKVVALETALGMPIDQGHYGEWGARNVGSTLKAVLERDLLGLEKTVQAFEAASGLPMPRWADAGRELGECVAMVRRGLGSTFQAHLGNMVSTLKPFLAALEELRGVSLEPKKEAPCDLPDTSL